MVNLAMPLAHQTTADYSAFTGTLLLGRPFRQPLESATSPGNYSDGLELFTRPAAANLYACFDGTLRWVPAAAAAGAKLVIDLPATSLRGTGSLATVPMVEAPCAQVVYDNIDKAAAKTALTTLLQTAYTAARAAARRPRTWHPVMSMQTAFVRRTLRLKAYLDTTPDAAAALAALVDDFLADAPAGRLPSIPVLAGEGIGKAAPYLASDTLPAGAPAWIGAPASPTRACRLTWRTLDVGGQPINPTYYLYYFLRQMLGPQASRVVSTLTNVVSGTALAHPLVTLLPALQGATPPRSREAIGGISRIPIGSLISYHGFPAETPVSRVEWRYTDTCLLEAQLRAGQTDTVPTLMPAIGSTTATTRRNSITAMWATSGTAIRQISDAFQIPCELLIALMGTESSGVEQAVRIEPLLATNRTDLRASAARALEEAYDKAAGIRGTVSNVTDNGNGTVSFDLTLDVNQTWAQDVLKDHDRLIFWGADRLPITANSAARNTATTPPKKQYTITVTGTTRTDTQAWVLDGYTPPAGVPDPWTGAVQVNPGATLTWDQLVQVVDGTKGKRISPGAIQTLISTARDRVAWIQQVAPGIVAALGLAAPPATAGGYLRDAINPGRRGWLLYREASLLCGAAYVRSGYNDSAQRTRYDLPLVGGAYNAGRPRAVRSRWGLKYHGEYVERAGPFFNVAADMFNTSALTPGATVRFMK